MALAKRFGSEFGLKNSERELSQIKSKRAEDGQITTRYQQNHEGIPVMGGELIINTNENGDLYSMNGEVSANLSLSTQATIDAEQAKEIALKSMAKWYQQTPQDFLVSEPALWVYDESLLRPSTRPAELVWRMEVTPRDVSMPVRELVLVNAQRGGISLHFNQVDTAWHMPEKTPLTQVAKTLSSTESSDQASTNHSSDATMTALLGATWYVAATGNDSNSCSSVGSPCRTINAAIGKAANGDTIRIAAGTYTSADFTVVWVTKSLTLSGGWNTAFTSQNALSIIDGQNTRLGVYVISVNGVDFITATIDHFIIKNGKGGSNGGGVDNQYADLTITDSSIQNNSASANPSSGGGYSIIPI